MWPAREIVDAIAPRIPKSCLNQIAADNIRGIADLLPKAFCSYYLECRLSAAQDQVDFLACMSSSQGALRDELLSELARLPPNNDSPAWRLVWDAARSWAGADGPWYTRIPFLWIELDHVGTRPAAQQHPSLCICVDSEYPDARPSAPSWDWHAAYHCGLDFLGPLLVGEYQDLLSADARQLLASCFARLPPSGRIIHVSFMLARKPLTIKLYGAISRSDLFGYLRNIGWSGSADVLAHLLTTFWRPDTADDTVYFDLALHGGVMPYVGVAFSQLHLSGAACADARRSMLLSLLESGGLCDPAKRAALLGWPGNTRESCAGESRSVRIHRLLDVKMTLSAAREVNAKGYLGFGPMSSVF